MGTDEFAPEVYVIRPTVQNRSTKIVQKLHLRESVQKIIEEKRSESILRRNNSNVSVSRAPSRVSKLSFGGDEIRTYEKDNLEKQKRCTKISFTAMNEVQEYEKEHAIEHDEKLKRKSNISLSSRAGDGGVSRSNSKFKSLAN